MSKTMFFLVPLLLFHPVVSQGESESVDCVDIYLGFDGKKDLKKAFSCFLKEEGHLFVSLMYLNGEGVERNLERAKTYLDKALKEGIPGADYLKAEVEKRINFPRQEFQRVDFCSHLAISTFFMNKCQHVAVRLGDIEARKLYKKIKTSLTVKQTREFDDLLAFFEDYREKDSLRTYLYLIDASIRTIASLDAERYLAANFNKLAEDVFLKGTLKKADKAELEKSDRQLNKTWKEMMGFYKTQYDDLKDSWLTYRNRTKELLKAARNAQRSWIKLRDQWVVTAKLLPFKSPAKKDIEASLKTRLTKGNLKKSSFSARFTSS